MKIYVKGGIVYWLLDGQDEENDNVITTDQDLGLIKETNTEELIAYVKTEDGADLLEPVKIAPELCYILDDNDNAILANDTTGLIAKRGLERREFAIYSEDDNSLIFYASHENVPRIGSQYNEKIVTNVYTNFLDTEYTEDNLPQWHEICELIESVSFDESFAKVRPSYTAYWFYGMINCTSIDTENLDTSQVTDMHDMFSELESLEELNVNNLDVRNVTSMEGIFYDCIKLTTIDISNWQTDSLTNAHGMFDSCSGLITMDVSNLDTSKVTNMNRMFYYCENLQTIYSDDDVFVTTSVTDGGAMFTNDTNLVGGNGTVYDSSHVNASYAHVDVEGNPGYFTDVSILYKAFAVYSEDDNSLTFYSDFPENVPTEGSLFKGKTATEVYTGFDTDEYTNGTSIPWNSYRSDIKSVSFDSSFAKIKPISTALWFENFQNCTSIDLTYLDTSKITNMRSMFYYCSSLTSLDTSKLNTSNVTDMSYMFYNCRVLTSLNLSSFNTSNVTAMDDMFYYCEFLKSLDVSNFDTSSVKDMDYIFCGCDSLTTIYSDDSNFVTTALRGGAYMFYGCELLVGGNGTKFDSFKTDSSMAHVDTSSNPGYFTAK